MGFICEQAVDGVCCSPPDHPIVSMGSPGQGGWGMSWGQPDPCPHALPDGTEASPQQPTSHSNSEGLSASPLVSPDWAGA